VKLVFLGTPPPAAAILREIVSAGHEVSLVITRPDAKRGRGSALSPSPVKEVALELGLPVSHSLAALDDVDAELGVVVAYGALIPASRLEKLPMLNVHFSLLPRWRGAAPVERCILAGDIETGVGVMTLEPTLDTGPVHLELRTEVGDKTSGELLEELTKLGGRAITKVLSDPDLRSNATPQVGDATYAAKLSSVDFQIEPADSAVQALRVIRLERTRIQTGKGSVRVVRARQSQLSVPEGSISRLDGVILLGLSDGSLELVEVRPEGSKTMGANSWWDGLRVERLEWSLISTGKE
jgi:methionyl-tRNA formyltransferase